MPRYRNCGVELVLHNCGVELVLQRTLITLENGRACVPD
jgi:hypothetical protein